MSSTGIADYRSRVFRLYSEEKYREALRAAKQAAEKFPDYEAKTTYWIACLENRLGNHDEAIHTLQRAVKKGIWWPEQSLQDPDLKSIRDRPEFKALEAEIARLKHEQPMQLTPDLMVRTPPNYSDNRAWPSLMTFHQRYGERPELSAEPWASILSAGTILAAPWSSQVYCSDGRCWDRLESSEEDVKWAVSRLTTQYSVDQERFVFGGFSQGGGLAIWSTLKRLGPTSGFVAVGPSDWVVPEKSAPDRKRPSEAFTSLVQTSDCAGLRGTIIIGDKDAFLPKIEPLYETMVNRGLEGKLLVEKDLGHEYPEDFAIKLKTAVDFVLKA